MKKIKETSISEQEKCFLYMEIFQIFFYLLLGLLQFSFSLKIYVFWYTNSTKYYYYLMNSGITPSSYTTDLRIINDTSQKCQDYGLSMLYAKHEFMNINQIQLANLIDVTSTTYINPSSNSSFTQNNTMLGNLYYDVDINSPGSTTVDLLTNMPMYAWKNYSICNRMLNIDANQEAFQIIPITDSCKGVYGMYAVDCGSYRNDSFRLCIRKEYLSYSSIKIPYLEYDVNNTKDNVCPFNYIRFKSSENPNFDSSDPNSNFYLMYMSWTQKNKGLDNDTNLLFNIGLPKFNGALNMTRELYDKEFPFLTTQNTIKVGEPYGVYDPFNTVVDSYDWSNFYNESTFFIYINPQTKEMSSSPGFLPGNDKKSFYRLINLTNQEITVDFSFFSFKLITKVCYENVFKASGRSDILGIVYKNRVKFITESSGLLICWAIVSIFISGFNQIYIRFYIIYQKLNNTLEKNDRNSEFLSKMMTKFFQLIVFIVSMSAVIYNKNRLTFILDNLTISLNNSCYDIYLSEVVSLYIDFLQIISNNNNLVMIFVICSFSGEVLISFTYFMIWHQEYKEKLEKLKEEEEKRRAEEILLRAMKKEE
jgi:hypothetical protein